MRRFVALRRAIRQVSVTALLLVLVPAAARGAIAGAATDTTPAEAGSDAAGAAADVAAAGALFEKNLDAIRRRDREAYLACYLSEENGRAGVRHLAAHGTDAVKVWFIPVAERNFGYDSPAPPEAL